MVDRLVRDKQKTFPPQNKILALTPWLLALITGTTLLANIPSAAHLSEYGGQAFMVAFLTGMALLFGVRLLDEVVLSLAHVVGMVIFLAQPEEALSLLIWANFAGAILGGAVTWMARGILMGRHAVERLYNLAFTVTRVTLTFVIAGHVYVALDGPLPLQSLTNGTFSEVYSPLLVYGIIYVSLYFALSAMKIQANGYQPIAVIKAKLLMVLAVLFMPIPFIIFSAEIASNASTLSEVIRYLGLAVVIIGLHVLNESEHQLRHQLDELQTLADIKRAMRSNLDPDDLFMAVYQQTNQLLGVENFTVALQEPERARLENALVIRRGKSAPRQQQETLVGRYASTLVDKVLENGTPLLLSEKVQAAAQAMQVRPPGGEVTSWMGVPLISGERTLGVLTASSEDQEQQFDDKDLRLFNIIADSASVAIDNALLYARQSERAEQMTTLNQISALLSGTLSPDTVLDTVISSASALAEAHAVSVYLLTEDMPGILPLTLSAGLSDRFEKNPPSPILWQNHMTPLHQHTPLMIADVTRDPQAAGFRNLLIDEGMLALVELPLVVGENGLGVLVMYFNQVQHFSSEQLEVLRAFARQAAQSITNARTYSTTDAALHRSLEQLTALSEIGRTLSATISLKTIGNMALTRALETTDGESGVVVIYDDSDRLQVIARQGYPDGTFEKRDDLWHGISKQVLLTGKIHGANSPHPDYPPWLPTTQSQLSVPILRGNEVRGYITLESMLVNGFSAEDTHFVAQIANQATIAIDNALFFDRITEANDRMRAILNAMEEAVILINIWGKIILVNPRVEMLGLEPKDLRNQYLSDLLQDTEMEFAERLGFSSVQQIAQVIYDLGRSDMWKDFNAQPYGVRVNNRDLFIQRYFMPITDEQEEIIGGLLVFYDKTEEHELNRAREELSRMIIHDLRSPLTAVTTSLKLLRELTTEDNEVYSVVQSTTETSSRAVRKLLARVDSLLDIAKMESGSLDLDTDLTVFATLVDSVCSELQPLSDELEVGVVVEPNDALPLLNVDADKVERLLLNLVDNALKYSKAQGTVTIRAHLPSTNGAPDGFIRADVIDNGPGIPDEYKNTIFDSFMQVEGRSKVRRGVGLGLSFCKLVVEAHDGRIWIEDNPDGGGSVFAFTLPVADLNLPPDDD